MIIKGDDFEMEQLKGAPFFDLSVLYTVNAGKENERTEMKIVGSGLPFEACLKHLVTSRLELDESECTLTEFVEKYKEEVDKIANSLIIDDEV